MSKNNWISKDMDSRMGGVEDKAQGLYDDTFYKVVATAEANQTYGEQLKYLKTYYDKLSSVQKLYTVITLGTMGNQFRFTSEYCFSEARESQINFLNMLGTKYTSTKITTTGITIENLSNTVNPYILRLVLY